MTDLSEPVENLQGESLEAVYHALTAGRADAALQYTKAGLGPRRLARLEALGGAR